MTIADLSPALRRARLRDGRLRISTGPFLVELESGLEAVDRSLATLYPCHPVELNGKGGHFHVRIDPPSLFRRVVRRQVQFDVSGRRPFIPLPLEMAPLMLEAGLNWCIGALAHHLIVVHSATLERDGCGLLLPAPPGSGKSTLCAALVARGWRLLSDEFALIDPVTGELIPVPRPVALKEASIDLIQGWAPEAVFGPRAPNNEGQVVAYMRPPDEAVRAAAVRCRARLVVVPRYSQDSAPVVTALTRARTVLHLADSSFNYNLHGRSGFERLAEIAEQAQAYSLKYSRLEDGVHAVESLRRALP